MNVSCISLCFSSSLSKLIHNLSIVCNFQLSFLLSFLTPPPSPPSFLLLYPLQHPSHPLPTPPFSSFPFCFPSPLPLSSLLLFLFFPPCLIPLPSLLHPSLPSIALFDTGCFSFFCSRMGTLLSAYFTLRICPFGVRCMGGPLSGVLNFFLCPLCF